MPKRRSGYYYVGARRDKKKKERKQEDSRWDKHKHKKTKQKKACANTRAKIASTHFQLLFPPPSRLNPSVLSALCRKCDAKRYRVLYCTVLHCTVLYYADLPVFFFSRLFCCLYENWCFFFLHVPANRKGKKAVERRRAARTCEISFMSTCTRSIAKGWR